jgi:hypothetical protein
MKPDLIRETTNGENAASEAVIEINFNRIRFAQICFVGLSIMAVAGSQAPEAWSQSRTNSATFNPVHQVDEGSGSTGLNFTGISAPINGVRATINLTKCDDPISTTGACQGADNSFNNEIRLRLRSPNGTIVNLVNFDQLSGQMPGNTVTWTFSNTASGTVSGTSLISGTYLPASSLSVFSGEGGNGTWDLLFDDSTLEDPLSINSWLLELLWQAAAAPNTQPYASNQSIGLDALKNQRELVLNEAGECDRRGWVVYDSDKNQPQAKTKKHQSLCIFAEGGNANGTINGTSSLGGYNTANASSAYGLEWKASKQWTIGAAYGYGSTNLSNFNFQDTSATIASTINSGALYGVYRPDKQQRWKLAGLFGYSGFSYTGSRSYLGDVATSAYNASGYTGAIQASYDIPLTTDYNGEKNRLNPIRIKPMLGLAYGSHQQAGFAESGAGTLVTVQGQTTNSLLGSVGVSLEAPIALNQKKTTVLIPKIGVAYQYDFLADQDGNRSITASLQDDATNSYTVQGQTRGSSNLQLNLGADLQLNPKTVLYAGVNYQAFNTGDQFGYQGGLRYKF